MESLEERVSRIEERNRSVELDKHWETSWTRRLLIAAFTYITIGIFLSFIHVEQPWLTAIVPALAFTLSTLTMPFLKKMWLRETTRQ